MKTNLMLADDQYLFAESLKIVMESCTEDIRVVKIAKSGTEAIKLADIHHPDIILMDVRMPDMDGLKATAEIHAKLPEIKIIMLTTFDDDDYIHQALLNGAVGYLLKEISTKELITAIRAVKNGAILISPGIVAKIAAPLFSALNNPAELIQTLTKREKEILALIAQGYNNKEISDRLYMADQTVRNHLVEIYAKLQVRDRLQAMKVAVETGFYKKTSN